MGSVGVKVRLWMLTEFDFLQPLLMVRVDLVDIWVMGYSCCWLYTDMNVYKLRTAT